MARLARSSAGTTWRGNQMTRRTSRNRPHPPTMTAHHFEYLAEILRDAKLTPERRDHLAEHFASQLRRTNPRFDPDTFIDAVLNG